MVTLIPTLNATARAGNDAGEPRSNAAVMVAIEGDLKKTDDGRFRGWISSVSSPPKNLLLTGWHVPKKVNNDGIVPISQTSLPEVFDAMADNNGKIEELTIEDMHNLLAGGEDTLSSFERLLSSGPSSLKSLNLGCSSSSDQKQSLKNHPHAKRLGKALRSNKTLTSLKLLNLEDSVLFNLLSRKATMKYIRLPSPIQRRFFRNYSPWFYWIYPTYYMQRKGSCLQSLVLQQATLSTHVMSQLVEFLGDHCLSINDVTLSNCQLCAGAIEYLMLLLEGKVNLNKLTLQRLWLKRCTCYTPPAATLTKVVKKHKKLGTRYLKHVDLQYLTASEDDKVRINNALCNSPTISHLTLLWHRYSYIAASHMQAVQALANNMEAGGSTLLRLALEAVDSSEFMSHLSRMLVHPQCKLEELELKLYDAPVEQKEVGLLGSLVAALQQNNTLKRLKILDQSLRQGDGVAAVEKLSKSRVEELARAFPHSPNLKSFQYTCNHVVKVVSESDADVDKIFCTNTTLEEVCIGQVRSLGVQSYGLRNRILFTLAQEGRAKWQPILQAIQSWLASDILKSLGADEMDVLFLSGIWMAIMECPDMVFQLEK